MAKETFNRYEHKYLLDKETFRRITGVLDMYMNVDAYNIDHAPYTITNLYYDTPDNALIRSSLAAPSYKEKLRLRAYGVPDAESKVYLEIKKKAVGMVGKRRTALTLPEAYAFASTGRPPAYQSYMNAQIMSEIAYFIAVHPVVPKVYIAYDRIAYFEKDNCDLRISFDMNIRSRRYDLLLESGDHGDALLPPDTYLMEIKTAFAKPLWLARMLSDYDIRRVSFSKYGTEYRNRIAGRGQNNNEKEVV